MPLAKPSGGLEELVDATSGKEIVATPILVDKYADLKKKYEKFLVTEIYDWQEWSRKGVKEVLLPSDINLFLQQTREYENHTRYNINTGFFSSQLIQNSYNAGNNEFELDVTALKLIHNICFGVSGTEERMVRVVIKGEAGDVCVWNVRNFTFTIEKAGDWCGFEAQHSTFTIGKAGDNCGREAQFSTFKTNNKDQYEKFKESVPQNKENTLYLLSQNGSILKGGKW